MSRSFTLIGPGKVGCAIAHRLLCAGYQLQAVIGRDLERVRDACSFIGCSETLGSLDLNRAVSAPLILIAVPDDQIEATATELSRLAGPLSGKTLVHFSGLHSAACLKSGADLFAASIHPLLPFANRQLASQSLSGCPCAIEGDAQAVSIAEELVDAFSGQPFIIRSEAKPLYHAAACITSNYLVTLTACARDLLKTCGVNSEEATTLILPLLKATLSNLEILGPDRGLTGPIVRGDSKTIAHHITALTAEHPELTELYRTLGERTLALAKSSQRIPEESTAEIITILTKNIPKSPNN